MSNPAKNCRWVLADGTYCELPTGYTMVEDGNEPGAPKVRKYRSFCPKHQAIVDKDDL